MAFLSPFSPFVPWQMAVSCGFWLHPIDIDAGFKLDESYSIFCNRATLCQLRLGFLMQHAPVKVGMRPKSGPKSDLIEENLAKI